MNKVVVEDLFLPKNEFRISITSLCNMKCVYCHNEGNNNKNMLSLSDIKKILNNSYGLHMSHIRLTGGEPLIHPQIYEICKMLYEDYNLKIGINTNCVEITKLLQLIEKGWIDRVVVGLDYYNGKVSKNSIIGVSSKTILKNILKIKNTGCNVSISTVYNNDYDNIYNLVNWCVTNNIRIKIIELIENKIYDESDLNYIDMRNKIIEDFDFDVMIDELEEFNCYKNNFNYVSFFPSLCRIRRCDICKKVHLRITADGKIKQCLHYSEKDKDVLGNNGRKNILETIKSEVDFHR